MNVKAMMHSDQRWPKVMTYAVALTRHKCAHIQLALQVKRQYCGLPVQETVAYIISRCGNCNQRQSKTTRAPLRPIICNSFCTRVQMDLIDMRSMARDGFNWILVFICHFSRFVILFALMNKMADIVKEKV